VIAEGVAVRRFLVLASVLFVSSCPVGAAEATIAQILGSPATYDGRHVDVTGKVSKLHETTSCKGTYFTFLICAGQCIFVAGMGTQRIADGQTVAVHGTFAAIKHLGSYTRYNEIDADQARADTPSIVDAKSDPGQFNEAQVKGNIAAMRGDFDLAIAAWSAAERLAMSRDHSYCGGEFERVQIRAARDAEARMLALHLTREQAAAWEEQRDMQLWMRDRCDVP
jgi:hypothetical protein